MPKGNENATMRITDSVFPDSIKGIWENFRVFNVRSSTCVGLDANKDDVIDLLSAIFVTIYSNSF
ncbi:MAG: hypothetical protein ABW118_19305, partial [Candidatus Thiodiazotropha sp.]